MGDAIQVGRASSIEAHHDRFTSEVPVEAAAALAFFDERILQRVESLGYLFPEVHDLRQSGVTIPQMVALASVLHPSRGFLGQQALQRARFLFLFDEAPELRPAEYQLVVGGLEIGGAFVVGARDHVARIIEPIDDPLGLTGCVIGVSC